MKIPKVKYYLSLKAIILRRNIGHKMIESNFKSVNTRQGNNNNELVHQWRLHYHNLYSKINNWQ